MQTILPTTTGICDHVLENLERLRFRLHVLEASVRDSNPMLADLLSDFADEAQDSFEKVEFLRSRDAT